MLERQHVQSVHLKRRALGVWRAIRFETDDGSGQLVWLYSPDPGRVLEALERLGWPVDRG